MHVEVNLSHYFKPMHTQPVNRKRVPFRFLGVDYEFETHENIFSRDHVDQGTVLLLHTLPKLNASSVVLDLGCGYGVVGICLKRVYPDIDVICSEINADALALTKLNARLNSVDITPVLSDGLQSIEKHCDVIVFNPPIRIGKLALYSIYADAIGKLTPQGTLWLVIRKDKGAESTLRYLRTLGAETHRVAHKDGFWILSCKKN